VAQFSEHRLPELTATSICIRPRQSWEAFRTNKFIALDRYGDPVIETIDDKNNRCCMSCIRLKGIEFEALHRANT
jgi:hypothetical protein